MPFRSCLLFLYGRLHEWFWKQICPTDIPSLVLAVVFLYWTIVGKMGGQKLCSFALIPICYIVFLTFVWLSRGYQSGIEYFFGSYLMILYATCVFGSIVQMKVRKSVLLQQLSNCFLPVYALHNFVIAFVLKINITSVLGVYAVLADYLLVASITLTLSWLLMKIPYLDKVFKI